MREQTVKILLDSEMSELIGSRVDEVDWGLDTPGEYIRWLILTDLDLNGSLDYELHRRRIWDD